MHLTITAVPGILAGHATDPQGLTGVTAVLCPGGATVAAAVRGGAPGTRETDLARPGHLVEQAQAVLLCGGSAMGLAAADGAVRWLRERGHGYATPAGPVPIVPAAVVFDLMVGAPTAPDAAMGYAACAAAGPEPLPEGNVGAGAGCSAGKLLGLERATKTGLGSDARAGVAGRWTVGAVVAANPAGEIRYPGSGRILAGVRAAGGGDFVPLTGLLVGNSPALPAAGDPLGPGPGAGDPAAPPPGSASGNATGPPPAPAAPNTVIAVVATDAALTREQAWRVACMAHAGIARAVFPSHSPFDGDTVFVLATGRATGAVDAAGLTRLGAAASLAVSDAIVRAALLAAPAGGLPAGSNVQA